jgi:hypothetical protein
MTYYIFLDNRKLNGAGQCRQLTKGVENIEVSEELYNAYIGAPTKYIYSEGKIIENPNYETERLEEEAKRIAMLKMTPLDFIKALEEVGVSYAQIKELCNTNEEVEKQLRFCNHVYRGNPLLDKLCGSFNVTTEQLNELFKKYGT